MTDKKCLSKTASFIKNVAFGNSVINIAAVVNNYSAIKLSNASLANASAKSYVSWLDFFGPWDYENKHLEESASESVV